MALGSMCEVNCGGTEKRKGRSDAGKKRGKQKNPAKPKATKVKAKSKTKPKGTKGSKSKTKPKGTKGAKSKTKAKGTKGAKSKTHAGEDYTGHKGDISKSKGKDVKKDNKKVDYSKKTLPQLKAILKQRKEKGYSKLKKADLIHIYFD